MRRPLPAEGQVSTVMARVLAQAADSGRKATVTAVERALGIPHATFDRNYRHLIDDFRQRAHEQSTTAKRTRAASSGKDPDQVIQRLRRENEDLRRLVKIYAESIRQLTLDHLELQTKLNATASITTLPTRRNQANTVPAPNSTAVKSELVATDDEHQPGCSPQLPNRSE